jgi:hypothetical protein
MFKKCQGIITQMKNEDAQKRTKDKLIGLFSAWNNTTLLQTKMTNPPE